MKLVIPMWMPCDWLFFQFWRKERRMVCGRESQWAWMHAYKHCPHSYRISCFHVTASLPLHSNTLYLSLSLSLATKYYAKSRKPLLLMGIHMTHACKAACLCKNHAGHAACSSMQSSSWLISQHYMLCVCVCGLIVPSNCHMQSCLKH